MVDMVQVYCGKGRRIVMYPNGGGMHVECYVDGPGWVLDDDADVADAVLASYLSIAATALSKAADKLA